MSRKIGGLLFGISLCVACAGSRPAARSPGAPPSALGGGCDAEGDCQSGLVCRKGACVSAKEDAEQKAIEDAEEQGELYGR